MSALIFGFKIAVFGKEPCPGFKVETGFSKLFQRCSISKKRLIIYQNDKNDQTRTKNLVWGPTPETATYCLCIPSNYDTSETISVQLRTKPKTTNLKKSNMRPVLTQHRLFCYFGCLISVINIITAISMYVPCHDCEAWAATISTVINHILLFSSPQAIMTYAYLFIITMLLGL